MKQRNRPVKVASAAPGLENAPVASAAVLAAMGANSNLTSSAERQALRAEVHDRRSAGILPAVTAASGRRTGDNEDSVEVAGFWGAPDGDGDSMQGARFHVKLDRPRAPIGVALGH